MKLGAGLPRNYDIPLSLVFSIDDHRGGSTGAKTWKFTILGQVQNSPKMEAIKQGLADISVLLIVTVYHIPRGRSKSPEDAKKGRPCEFISEGYID